MTDVFKFEVVGEGGEIVGDNSQSSSSGNSSSNASSQTDGQRRADESHQLRLEAAQRARQRERDRREDRAERRKRQSDNISLKRQDEIDRMRSRVHRRQISRERAMEAELNKGQTLRRRFINDFFGALNHAHLGRRVNHGIDFVRSLAGSQVSPFSGNGERSETRSLARNVLDQVSNVSNVASRSNRVDSRDVINNDNREITHNNINQLPERLERPNGDIRRRALRDRAIAALPPIVEQRTNSRGELPGPIADQLKGITQNRKRQSQVDRINSAFERGHDVRQENVTRRRIFSRQNPQNLRQLGQRFGRLSGRVGPARAAGLLGGRVVGNVVGGLAKMVPVLGTLGPVGIAAAAAIAVLGGGAIVAGSALWALNRLTGRMADSIANIPGPVAFARLDHQLALFDVRLGRSARLGGGLAQIERLKSDNEVKTFKLFDEIAEPLLPITQALNRLLGIGIDFLTVAIKVDANIGFLSTLKRLGEFLDNLLDSDSENDTSIVAAIKLLASFTGVSTIFRFLSSASGFFDDEKSDRESNLNGAEITKELFKFMNNPIGDIDSPFAFNAGLGDVQVPNAFDGGI